MPLLFYPKIKHKKLQNRTESPSWDKLSLDKAETKEINVNLLPQFIMQQIEPAQGLREKSQKINVKRRQSIWIQIMARHWTWTYLRLEFFNCLPKSLGEKLLLFCLSESYYKVCHISLAGSLLKFRLLSTR